MGIAIIVIVALVVFVGVFGNQMTKAKARQIRGQAALQGRPISRRDAKLAAQEQLRQRRAQRKTR